MAKRKARRAGRTVAGTRAGVGRARSRPKRGARKKGGARSSNARRTRAATRTRASGTPGARKAAARKVARKRPPQPARKRTPKIVKKRVPQPARKRAPKIVKKRVPQPARKRAPKIVKRRVPARVTTRRSKPVRKRPSQGARKRLPKATRKTASKSVQRRVTQAARTRAPKPARTVPSTVAAPTAPPTVVRTRIVRPPTPARRLPALNRERRIFLDDDLVQTPPSTLDFDRSASAARSGGHELREKLRQHTEASPALTGGDVDADWGEAYAVGDETPGGDNPTPDQGVVDDIGKALGVQYEDSEELKGEKKISDRDRKRWELDPASADDYEER